MKFFSSHIICLSSKFLYLVSFFFLVFIYFERERMHVHEQGRDRERERERIPSRLRAVSAEPDVGLELTNHEIMTLAEIGHLTN